MVSTVPPFDPKAFLGKIGKGRTIARYRKNEEIFARFMNDKSFQKVVTGWLSSEAYRKLRRSPEESLSANPEDYPAEGTLPASVASSDEYAGLLEPKNGHNADTNASPPTRVERE